MSRHRSLVPIRGYESREALLSDVEALRAAGIGSEASGLLSDDGTWQLEVHAHDVGPALDVLSGAGSSGGDALACPRCASTRVRPLPPYFLMALVIAGAIAMALAYTDQWWPFAGFMLLATVGLEVYSRRVTHWRCQNCQHQWNHFAVQEQQRARRRAEQPE